MSFCTCQAISSNQTENFEISIHLVVKFQLLSVGPARRTHLLGTCIVFSVRPTNRCVLVLGKQLKCGALQAARSQSGLLSGLKIPPGQINA
jgi:hypothetical protein